MNEKLHAFRESRHIESSRHFAGNMRVNNSAWSLKGTKCTTVQESDLEAVKMQCSEFSGRTSRPVVGLAEYLDGFHMIVEMYDHSILSSSDVSLLCHRILTDDLPSCPTGNGIELAVQHQLSLPPSLRTYPERDFKSEHPTPK
jgi:hypothetical protein